MTSTRSICVAGIWSRALLCVRPERRPLMSTVTLGLPRRLMPPVGFTATDGTPFSTSLADPLCERMSLPTSNTFLSSCRLMPGFSPVTVTSASWVTSGASSTGPTSSLPPAAGTRSGWLTVW